jgi:hypothetical protein
MMFKQVTVFPLLSTCLLATAHPINLNTSIATRQINVVLIEYIGAANAYQAKVVTIGAPSQSQVPWDISSVCIWAPAGTQCTFTSPGPDTSTSITVTESSECWQLGPPLIITASICQD